MPTTSATPMTVAEYLDFERAAETKHEFHDGELREMVGGSHPHILISTRIASLLDAASGGREFAVYQSDMRVRLPGGSYYYPDVSVAPWPPELDEDAACATLLNPLVVVECLSDSTEHIDRGEKLDNYRRLPSLTDYLLVAQDRPRVEHWSRNGERWRLTILADLSATVALPSLGCDLPLATVYERVFPTDV